MGLNLYAANSQWASRPNDERFWTVREARDACKTYADTATEEKVDFGRERVVVIGGSNLALTADGGRGARVATFTNWGFTQLARMASAPAEYLRKLPAELAGQCLEVGLDKHFAGRDNLEMKGLIHNNGSTVLRALTSERYTRFWNYEVFDKLLGLETQGWRVPPARPVRDGNDGNSRVATEADVLTVRGGSGGISVNVGDRIAPAGIYASDHDMFAFMVNEETRIEDGSDGGLSRGFFIQNSEVGASSLRVSYFHYRHVCGNHIVWDASNVIEVAVRHVGNVEGRFEIELASSVGKFMQASADEETARVRRARTIELGATKDDVLEAVFKAIAGPKRRSGMPAGISMKLLTEAYETAEAYEHQDGSPRTVWGYVNGLTRLSQKTGYMDERANIDRAGSSVLALAV